MTNGCSTDVAAAGVLRDAVRDLVARAAATPGAALAEHASLAELGFDSLRHFQLMLEVEGLVGREFAEEEIDAVLACATVGSLADLAVNLGRSVPARGSADD